METKIEKLPENLVKVDIEIPAKDANWKNVVCNTKNVAIKINKIIFLKNV